MKELSVTSNSPPSLHLNTISAFSDVQTQSFLGDTPHDDVWHKAICIVSPPSQTNQTLFTQALKFQKESRIKSIKALLHHCSWSRGKKIRDHIPKEGLASQLPTSQVLLLRNYRIVSIPCIWWALLFISEIPPRLHSSSSQWLLCFPCPH